MQIRNRFKVQKLVRIYQWNNFLCMKIFWLIFLRLKFKKKISISKDDKYESLSFIKINKIFKYF